MTAPIDIAILAALDEEIESLSAGLSDTRTESTGALSVIRGRLGGCEVIVGRTGIGKVNAALHTQSVIIQYRPRAILFTGVAGSLVAALKVGDLIVATHAIQHDYDLTPFDRAPGFVPIGSDVKSSAPEFFAQALKVLGKQSLERLQGVSYFETSPALRRLAFQAYDTISKKHDLPPALAGAVASGDQFIADFTRRERIQRSFGALCVEMEGAAAAQACFLSGTPFLLLRVISDAADGSAAVQFDALAREVAARTAELIGEIANLFFREKTGSIEREFKWIVLEPDGIGVTRKIHSILKRLGHRQKWEKTHLRDIYFDTPSHALAASGATLRLRENDNGVTCSLKSPGKAESGLFRRHEVEWLVGDSLADNTCVAPLLDQLGKAEVDFEALNAFTKTIDSSWSELAATALPAILIENDRSFVVLDLADGTATLTVDDFSAGRPELMPSLKGIEIELEIENESLLHDSRLSAILTAIESSLSCVGSTKSKYLRALEASPYLGS